MAVTSTSGFKGFRHQVSTSILAYLATNENTQIPILTSGNHSA